MTDDLRFETDIRPLFTEWDRSEMDWRFDLWSYEDVIRYADRILERLEEQTMPCDTAWDGAKIETFKTWISQGCQP